MTEYQVFSEAKDMAAAIEKARLQCEAENGGVPMVCTGTRQTQAAG